MTGSTMLNDVIKYSGLDVLAEYAEMGIKGKAEQMNRIKSLLLESRTARDEE